jgi:hypothetical protein
MTEFVRAFPQAAPIIGDLLAKNLDWPGADEIAKRLAKLVPGQQQVPPEVQQMIQQGQEVIKQLQAKVQELEADKSIDQFNANTQRMKVTGELKTNEFKATTAALGHADDIALRANTAASRPA